MHSLKEAIKRITPQWLINSYHYLWALFSALVYRFPSRKIFVVGVTGTNGKTTVAELINAILEEAGYTTALSDTFRFKVGDISEPNTLKMTMPGRFALHRFLRTAVKKHCSHAVLEMTSEGARQFRHKFIALDALVFTNLTPEHIESHGSFASYKQAKLSLVRALARSPKERTIAVANTDDTAGAEFLAVDASDKRPYTLSAAEPYELLPDGVRISFEGESIRSPLRGTFNIYNILAAATFARALDIPVTTIARALERFGGVRGRLEKVDAGQPFDVVVDYAHTPDALEKVYDVYRNSRKICVLGATGGGRDKWKRPELGRIAGDNCTDIILTDEDPYDEDPREIADAVARGIRKPIYRIEMDRRKAIRTALEEAEEGDAVIITGKGTDPYIMRADGEKEPWDDARIAREELEKLRSPA